jgi:hypothetical protein
MAQGHYGNTISLSRLFPSQPGEPGHPLIGGRNIRQDGDPAIPPRPGPGPAPFDCQTHSIEQMEQTIQALDRPTQGNRMYCGRALPDWTYTIGASCEEPFKNKSGPAGSPSAPQVAPLGLPAQPVLERTVFAVAWRRGVLDRPGQGPGRADAKPVSSRQPHTPADKPD